MIRFIEHRLPLDASRGSVLPATPLLPGGRRLLKALMDTVDRYHFWFALIVAAGLVACLATKTIDATGGSSLIGIVIGHYLGKSQAARVGADSQSGNRGDQP